MFSNLKKKIAFSYFIEILIEFRAKKHHMISSDGFQCFMRPFSSGRRPVNSLFLNEMACFVLTEINFMKKVL